MRGEREKEGMRERGYEKVRGSRAGQQAGIFKVRLGLVEIETEIKRDRNKET